MLQVNNSERLPVDFGGTLAALPVLRVARDPIEEQTHYPFQEPANITPWVRSHKVSALNFGTRPAQIVEVDFKHEGTYS